MTQNGFKTLGRRGDTYMHKYCYAGLRINQPLTAILREFRDLALSDIVFVLRMVANFGFPRG